MKHQVNAVSAVPTNIITGFLGVGKTTVILNLLKQKPTGERWAVLVNEFGEVGIDGGFIQGHYGESTGVFIREVPGGCMCCAAGLPMQIALNQLLARAKPDRLLIEPTGLGHPKEVLEVLSAEHYQEVLDIQQCITLVDARKLSDSRYTSHATFNQQIDMADNIIGHKEDLYDSHSHQNLKMYVRDRRGDSLSVSFAQQGVIDIALLMGKSSVVNRLKQKNHDHHHKRATTVDVNEQAFPDCGFLKVENSGEGYQSIGWRFAPNKIFNKEKLFAWLSSLDVERAKGVFITTQGVLGYNRTPDSTHEVLLDDCLESRIEIITQGGCTIHEAELLKCIAS